ncbi:interferon-induced protein with tetratricopeptide repeats 5 [Centrocercus urophasianus]|uniref:interferon-induced protein with tetratricopeptide repeats 5 n=1 Tax=Centrocercus urophasianus TaxID=9002 RepID=UPI001C647E41|nr:interferon-induced protein with tetratricopeptide repeats 5 [Centrocercus urophasianus]
MSTISKNSLKNSLLQIECYFTWTLLKEDIDLASLEESIYDQIEFFIKPNVSNYNLLSYIYHLQLSDKAALEYLQKAEEEVKKYYPDEIDRRSLITWGNYAWIYYHMGRYEEAQKYINKVENSCKKLSNTAQLKIQLPEIYAEQGFALLKFGGKYYNRAKECFENALREEPNNPEFNAGYAIAMYRLEEFSNRRCEEVNSSLEPLKRALELNPMDTYLLALLALKLQDSDQVDEAERCIEEGMQKTPDLPYFLRYAAKFYRRKKELDKAQEVLERALEISPKSTFLLHQLGLCYRAKLYELKNSTRYPPQDQIEELIQICISHFKVVAEQKPKFFSALIDLARMYAEAKMYREAEETFQRALKINILTCSDKQEICYYYGNFLQYKKKSESEAIKYYKEGLKNGNHCFAKKIKQYLKRLLERRIQGGLGSEEDFSTLGHIHKLDGEKLEAIECYEKANEYNPDNEEYLSALCELRLSLSS